MLAVCIHQSATPVKPLLGEVNNTDYLITLALVGYIRQQVNSQFMELMF